MRGLDSSVLFLTAILHALDQIFITDCPFPSLFLAGPFLDCNTALDQLPLSLAFFSPVLFLTTTLHLTSCPFNSLAFS